MSHLPLSVDMRGKECVIVGGGAVAEKRAMTLLDADASITIVSPAMTPFLHKVNKKGTIRWLNKEFEAVDGEGAFLLVAATGIDEVDKQVEAAGKDVPLLNVAGNGGKGDIHFPARVSRGRLSIAISTGGASPVLAARIRKRLEEEYHEGYEEYLEFLFDCRMKVRHSDFSAGTKKEILHEILEEKYRQEREQKRMIAHLEEMT